MPAVMMTAYRRGEKLFRIDSLDCLAAVSTRDDMDLVEIAIAHAKPVLIGLNGHNTIVKTVGEDDEALSFDALYDTAFTTTDLDTMRRQKVDTPDQVKPDTFLMQIEFDLHARVPLKIALSAFTNGGCRPRLRELLLTEPLFCEAIREAMISHLESHFEFGDTVTYGIDDVTSVQSDVLTGDRAWAVLP